MKTTRKMALVEKIILGLLVTAAFCFARQCKWTDVDIHPAWSGSNQTSDEYFIASYECDDGDKGSTPTISNRFVRFAENNTILYYIRFSGTPICELLTFNNGGGVISNSATSSKCGL